MFTVDTVPNAINADGPIISPTDLRSIHDRIIRPQLLRVPGVVEVNPIGGFKREILVTIEPGNLLAYGLTQNDLLTAIAANNDNQGVGFIEHNGSQLLLRVPGQINSTQTLGEILITETNERPVQLKQVAHISEGKELRNGVATQNGREVVMSTVFMLIGKNNRIVADAVANELEQIKNNTPSRSHPNSRL